MCTFICDGSCRGQSTRSSLGGPLLAGAAGVAATACGLVWLGAPLTGVPLIATASGLTAVVAVPPLRRLAIQTSGIALVYSWRWVSGAPLALNPRPLNGPGWLRRVRWMQWPRWQRAAVRMAVTVLALSGLLAPLITALALAAATTGVTSAAVVRRRRIAARRGPIRVTARVGKPVPVAAESAEQGQYGRQTAGVR